VEDEEQKGDVEKEQRGGEEKGVKHVKGKIKLYN